MSEKSSPKMRVDHTDDDDNCSEFSVISVYDDQEDLESIQNGSSNVEDGPRMTYKDPSIHDSEFVDNLSVVSSHKPPSEKAEKLLEEMKASALSWTQNSMNLSGYLSPNAVAEIVSQNNELLTSIKSMFDSKENSVNNLFDYSSEITQLKTQLEAANARIVELEEEKTKNEEQFKSAEINAKILILRLESQLFDQCQVNKALREELDEKMDELKSQRLELSTQQTIISALQQEADKACNNLERIRGEYDEKIETLEKTVTSYHERNELDNSSAQINGPFCQVNHVDSTITCHLCQCDCPTFDYYTYHLRTIHYSKAENVEEIQTQNAIPSAPPTENDLISVVSEDTEFSLMRSTNDSDSVSTAEEFTDTSDTTEEEADRDIQFKTPDEEPDFNDASSITTSEIISKCLSPECQRQLLSGFYDDSHEIATSSNTKTSVITKLPSILRKSLDIVTMPFQRILDDIALVASNNETVQLMQREKSEIQRIPIPAQPLPTSQTVVEHQIFLCDCLFAFPTRGQLISHKAHCVNANA